MWYFQTIKYYLAHARARTHTHTHTHTHTQKDQGSWVAQSVKPLTSAQVMISQFVGWSPASGSVLTGQSLDPALDSMSPSLSLPLPPLRLSLSLSLESKHFLKMINQVMKRHRVTFKCILLSEKNQSEKITCCIIPAM